MLYIVCGHGAGDPGATSGKYQEADVVRQLAERIKVLGGDAVTVLDPKVNWYQTRGLNSYKFAKGDKVLELHTDSFGIKTARGGHVIIYGGYEADADDKRLADYIKGKFPGRAVTISKRKDLQNCNICATRQVNYRLLETCFISNPDDIALLMNDMDSVAEGILKAFKLKVTLPEASTPEEPVKPPVEPENLLGFAVGDLARPIVAVDYYGTKLASFVLKGTYKVASVKGDRIVLDQIVTAFKPGQLKKL